MQERSITHGTNSTWSRLEQGLTLEIVPNGAQDSSIGARVIADLEAFSSRKCSFAAFQNPERLESLRARLAMSKSAGCAQEAPPCRTVLINVGESAAVPSIGSSMKATLRQFGCLPDVTFPLRSKQFGRVTTRARNRASHGWHPAGPRSKSLFWQPRSLGPP